ncbi:MAG: NAD(P)-dependent alcohol dehydrogenase [Terriglobales bacterium]
MSANQASAGIEDAAQSIVSGRTSGYAALTAKAKLAPFSFERRQPREHDVLIDIEYCGICHSDIHQAREEWGEAIFPMVPGHEIVGTVNAVGSKVTKFKIGDRAGVGCFIDSCRTCPECRRGLEQYCSVLTSWTYNGREQDQTTPTYGGYSERIVVDEKYVLCMPVNLAPDASAPLLCAGITLYSPLKHWQAGPGKKVAIIGLGGLGHMGVKLAHALGAEVTVLSQSLRKQQDAKRLGADYFYATSDPETFSKLDRHFDLILNTVSADIDWNQYLKLLKVDGSMVVVGIPEKENAVAAASIVMGRRSLAGSAIGGIQETQEMLDFCGKHNIVSDIEVVPIQKVNEAYERVLKSDVRYRFVIDMASLKAR